MSSARHHSPHAIHHTTPLTPTPAPLSSRATSRRNLLRGGLALGVAGAATAMATGPAAARSGGLISTADYPDAEWIPANGSNFTPADRPSEFPIEFVVIHVTQGSFAGTVQHFQNPEAKVSAHYVVRSNDGHIAQMVHDKDVAWHAGNWDYNTRSIGIEHEGFVDDPAWFTDAMYAASAALTASLCDAWGIPRDRTRVIGHNEVPGADHTDPGQHWDWDRYMTLLAAA